MPVRRRSYRQYCGLAKALDVVGERWTLLIVRNLLLGAQRYSELLRGLPGITTNLLAKRLQEMEAAGLIERTGDGGASAAYRLTSHGARLEPAVHALASWGWHAMAEPRKNDVRSFDYLMVALRRRYRGGASLRAEIDADGRPYRVILAEDRADISRGDVVSPDVILRGDGRRLARLFMDRSARDDWPAGIEVEGRMRDARTLVESFAIGDV